MKQMVEFIAESSPLLPYDLVEQDWDVESNRPAQMNVKIFERHGEKMELMQFVEERKSGFLRSIDAQEIEISLQVKIVNPLHGVIPPELHRY
jgi:hypothetical protein